MNQKTNNQNINNSNTKTDFYKRLNINEKQFNKAIAWYHSAMHKQNQRQTH